METINADSMWKRLPHSAWEIVMPKCEMLWAPVLNRHIALTLILGSPKSDPETKDIWGSGERDGMEKDKIGDIGMREIQLSVVLLSWVPLGTPAQSYLGTL